MICATCGYNDDVKIGNGHSPASCKAARAIARAEKACVKTMMRWLDRGCPLTTSPDRNTEEPWSQEIINMRAAAKGLQNERAKEPHTARQRAQQAMVKR